VDLPQPVTVQDFYLQALVDEMRGLREDIGVLTGEVQDLRTNSKTEPARSRKAKDTDGKS
jgi:hypothetical protein